MKAIIVYYDNLLLCDKVYQRLMEGRWFSPGIPVSSTNKTDSHNITEISHNNKLS
jgi:hypothetical protein